MADKNYSFKQSNDIGRLDGELHPCMHTTNSWYGLEFTLSRTWVAAVILTVEPQIRQIVFASAVVFATQSPLIGPVR
jgi:hypothetical protein